MTANFYINIIKRILVFLLFSDAYTAVSAAELQDDQKLEKYISSFDYAARKEMKMNSKGLIKLLKEGKAQLIDIRFHEEYAAWRVEPSINIPLNELPGRLDKIHTDKVIVTAYPHNEIDHIVENLHSKINSLESVSIHYEPDHPAYQTDIELLAEDRKILSDRFGAAPWLRSIKTLPDGDIISDELIQNPSSEIKKGEAFHLAAWLISQRVDRVIMGPTKLDENIIALFNTLGIAFQQKEK